jgi:hypothetical protein
MKNRALQVLSSIALMLASTTFVPAASAADDKAATGASDFAELKAQLAQQQVQIEQLRKALEEQKKLLEATVKATEPAPTDRVKPYDVGQVASTSPIIPLGIPLKPAALPAPMPTAAAAPPRPADDSSSPLQIHLGDATITPVGFMDLTNTWRSTNSGASLKTNFGSYPYNNSPSARLSEDRLSVQNSRIGFRVDAKVKGANILGYYEGDFVGDNAGLNTQVSSNSMTYRLRLYWINVRKGLWEVQGGQSWSLITPNRKGLSALPADLFYGQVVDVNYINGLTWGRIPGVRFIVHPNDKVTAGISLENAEQYIGGSGGGGTPVLPAALSASNFNNEVNNGTTNTSVPNLHPDIIAKIAFEPTSRVHFEIAGMERTFKTFMPSTQTYFTKVGGGGSVNANVELVKNFRLVTNNFWSDGGGRYMFGVAPDLIIRADGSPSLIHSGSTVSGFEGAMKNTALYAYYGGIFIERNTALDVNKSLIGYGFSGSANSQNRASQELTLGLTQTFWKDSKYGALSFMTQYAYFFRNPWFVAAGAPKNAHEHTLWFNLRYTLPGTAPTIKY